MSWPRARASRPRTGATHAAAQVRPRRSSADRGGTGRREVETASVAKPVLVGEGAAGECGVSGGGSRGCPSADLSARGGLGTNEHTIDCAHLEDRASGARPVSLVGICMTCVHVSDAAAARKAPRAVMHDVECVLAGMAA